MGDYAAFVRGNLDTANAEIDRLRERITQLERAARIAYWSSGDPAVHTTLEAVMPAGTLTRQGPRPA